MQNNSSRISWDTSIKHYYRLGLETCLPKEMNNKVPKSNISRWRREPEDKYKGCELSNFIKEDIELLKRFNQSSNIKKYIKAI